MIDYELMKREHPKLKRKLTLAVKSKDPEKVTQACKEALLVWDRVGCWPDNWHDWNIALYDHTRTSMDDLYKEM